MKRLSLWGRPYVGHFAGHRRHQRNTKPVPSSALFCIPVGFMPLPADEQRLSQLTTGSGQTRRPSAGHYASYPCAFTFQKAPVEMAPLIPPGLVLDRRALKVRDGLAQRIDRHGALDLEVHVGRDLFVGGGVHPGRP